MSSQNFEIPKKHICRVLGIVCSSKSEKHFSSLKTAASGPNLNIKK